MCCPVGYSEEFIAVFAVKMSQIDTEKDKNHKTFQFLTIVSIFFSIFSTDFVNWNVEKGQQGKNMLSVMLRKR